MKIASVKAFAVKVPCLDRFGGQSEPPKTFPQSDYYVEREWSELYSVNTECILVRVETDDGLVGWGEGQAPVGPEVAAMIVAKILSPFLLGKDPLATKVHYEQMYRLMNVRGQTGGFMLDAIAAVDMALWDLKGKYCRQPICRLLGGPFRTGLPAYVSGLRKPTAEGQAALAQRYVAEGYAGVKIFLGMGPEQDFLRAEVVREAVPGEKGKVFVDCLCAYRVAEALALGRRLERLEVSFLESPIGPEDIPGHAEMARSLAMPVAGGEVLRTCYQFLPWLEAGALDILQPDVARCGVTGLWEIASLAHAHNLPVAPHVGVSLGLMMGATWQVSAALPNFLIQEHEPTTFELSGRLFAPPLRVENGTPQIPDRPGIGIEPVEPELSPYMREITG